jgi:hypothetical protein
MYAVCTGAVSGQVHERGALALPDGGHDANHGEQRRYTCMLQSASISPRCSSSLALLVPYGWSMHAMHWSDATARR